MASILEVVMLICFGFSWPINLVKNIRVRSAKGMSLPFILLIVVGYIAGIISKLIIISGGGTVHWYVMFFYVLNLIMVSANIFVYFINKRHDKMAGK